MCEDRYNKSEGYCGQKEMTAKEITAKEMTATADDRKREEKITKLTNGPVYPLLVKMAVPSMIGMIVSTVYSMTDTFFIGQLDDVDLTASVGIVFSFVSVIQAIGFWFGYGSGNYISRCLGKKDTVSAEKMAATAVLMAVVTGVVIAAAGLPFVKPLAAVLGAGEGRLLHATVRYLRITLLAVPFMLVSNVLYNQLRLVGSGRDSMMGLLAGMLLNMVLDPVLILLVHLDVAGAALASLAGQVTGVVILVLASGRNGNIRIDLKKASRSGYLRRQILMGGAPNFCRQGISSISSVLLNHAAMAFGTAAVAALTIAFRISYIAYADLLYLFSQELYDACAGENFDEAVKLIEARKEKRAFAERYWDKCMKDALAVEGDAVTGIGASNGQARGRVCVVHSPDEFYKLEKGDILVCTYTDPEWTPLFALAAGVVVDTGGTLSHAAIVAREYGIPAVLATGDATQKLKDGDIVIVNAGEGNVTVLDC